MKYKVVYTAGAKRDLRNIFRYISEELLAPENAAGQTDRIMAAIRKLVTMPNRNRLYEEEPWHSRGLRFFPVDNYLVFYKTNDETETVYIVRIMYRGRDVRNPENTGLFLFFFLRRLFVLHRFQNFIQLYHIISHPFCLFS